MKKCRIWLIMAVLCISLSGCSKIGKVQESTITVDKKGNVIQVLMEEFPEKEYEEEELEESIKAWIAEYEKTAGKDKISLEELKVKKDKARVQIKYASSKDYREFNHTEFFSDSMEKAVGSGLNFQMSFLDEKGEAVPGGTVPGSCMDAQVIMIQEPMQVLVPGKLLYVSKNMEIVSKNTVRLPADENGVEAYTQVKTKQPGYVIYKKK